MLKRNEMKSKKNAEKRILCLVKNEWFLEQAEDAGGIGHLNDKIFKKQTNKEKNTPKPHNPWKFEPTCSKKCYVLLQSQ